MNEARFVIEKVDPDDFEFVVLAIKRDVPICSHDKHFLKKQKESGGGHELGCSEAIGRAAITVAGTSQWIPLNVQFGKSEGMNVVERGWP